MPTRAQIRSELGKQRFTDAQMRGAIARLNLPAEDGHNYTDEQAAHIKSALLQLGQPQSQQLHGDRHTSFATNASQQAEADQRQLANTQKTKLDRLSSALDRAEQRRSEALEVLSDRLAYINDERIFLKDLLELAKQKTSAHSNELESDEEILEAAIEDVTRGFDSAWTWDYPALPEALGFAR